MKQSIARNGAQLIQPINILDFGQTVITGEAAPVEN
jgi:hypothetical protein